MARQEAGSCKRPRFRGVLPASLPRLGGLPELRYKVACLFCNAVFTLDDVNARVPEHPEGNPRNLRGGEPACLGSGGNWTLLDYFT